MKTGMIVFLVILGVFLFIGLAVIAVIEAKRMDKGKESVLSRQATTKDKRESKVKT